MTRRIGVFTGSRSEYGLLVPVMRAISQHDGLSLLVISGDPDPGTPEYPIAAHAPITRKDESSGSTPRAIGQGVLDLTDAFDALELDAVVIYGDRFEAFAAMIAATQMGLPAAHLEGGDLTQGGTLDDVVRHAMSKLAHLHFPTNEEAAGRLRALGEEDWRIHTVGFPPIDLIREGDFTQPDDVVAELGVDPERPILLFTQHPISTTPDEAGAEVEVCLAALERARQAHKAQLVLTYPNGDVGSDAIIAALSAFAAERPDVVLRKTLGRRLYHGVLAMAGMGQGACIGNSSSGLKETAAFHCPAIDVGPRQTGRLRGANVLHVPVETNAISAAIDKALFDQAFRDDVQAMTNPYGIGNTGPRIAEILAATDFTAPGFLNKKTLL